MKCLSSLVLGVSLLAALACKPDIAPSSAGEAPRSPAKETQRVLRATIDEDLPTLDPHLHLTIVGSVVLRNIFEPLVDVDAEGGFVPCLAERWESQDDRVWRFFLRPDVQFHDGRPVTADDVVASLDRVRNHPESEMAGFLASVESFSADAGIVEIVTERADPLFLESLAWAAVVPADAPDEIQEPVGTGPYRFVSYEREKALRLKAFEDYWNGPASEASAEFVIVPEAAEAVQRLETGEIDLVRNLPPRFVEQLESNTDFWVESRLSRSVFYIQLNPQVPPYDDPRIREAIDLALDREEVMEEVTLNHSRPASQVLGPDIFGHDSELQPTERDLDTARRLLDDAGFEDGPALRLETTEAFVAHGEAIARQLDDAGFETTVVARPWPELYEDLERGEVGAWYGVWSFDGSDAAMFFDAVVHSPTKGAGFGSANWSGFADPESDRMIRAAGEEPDPDRRQELLQAISRRITNQRVLIPVVWPLDLYGMRRDVQWEARQDGGLLLYDVHRKE